MMEQVKAELPNSLKSSLWDDAERYDEDSPFYKRATTFLVSIDWEAVVQKSKYIRQSGRAKLSPKYSIGTNNLVRHISFDDAPDLVARFRMDPIPEQDITMENVEESMQAEIAALLYVAQHTTIPVPTLYDYDHRRENLLGAPFMIMDYIDGLTADEMREQRNCGVNMFGTEEQDSAFRKRMAEIHAELASKRFPAIGRLSYDKVSKEFRVVSDCYSRKGPWKSSRKFYMDIADHKFQLGLTRAWTATQLALQPSATLPLVFQKLLPHYCIDDHGPFRLFNSDFGSHNVLVNDEFEILAVIDLDGLMTAPVEFVAQLPAIQGLSGAVPGTVVKKPAMKDRLDRAKPFRLRYKMDFIQAEQGFSKIEFGEAGVASSSSEAFLDWNNIETKIERKSPSSIMLMDGAEIVRTLITYSNYHPVKDEMNYLLRLLAEVYKKDQESSG